MAYNSTSWTADGLSKATNSTSTDDSLSINGTLTVGGASTLSSTLTVGVNDTGYDVKFFGATSGKYMLWDESEDELVVSGDINLSAQACQITLKDNVTAGLQIGSAGALDLLKISTTDDGPTLSINSSKTGLYVNLPTLELAETALVTGNEDDASVASITLDGNYIGSYTVTRHNYINLENLHLTGTTLTDACVFRFDANKGTHKAIDSGSAHPDIDTADAWMKININGTVHYIPCYTDKS